MGMIHHCCASFSIIQDAASGNMTYYNIENLLLEWISHYVHYKVWDEIT